MEKNGKTVQTVVFWVAQNCPNSCRASSEKDGGQWRVVGAAGGQHDVHPGGNIKSKATRNTKTVKNTNWNTKTVVNKKTNTDITIRLTQWTPLRVVWPRDYSARGTNSYRWKTQRHGCIILLPGSFLSSQGLTFTRLLWLMFKQGFRTSLKAYHHRHHDHIINICNQ